MHSASQQQAAPNDLDTRARREATLAAAQIPCANCGASADVYLRVAETRLSMPFAASQCDTCAAERIAAAQIAHAPIQLDALSGVSLVTRIDAIDLEELVRAVLDCAIGDHSIESVQSVPGAVAAVVVVLAGKIRRGPVPSEQAAVIAATRSEVTRRYHQRRADLLETSRALHSVFGVFGQRAVG